MWYIKYVAQDYDILSPARLQDFILTGRIGRREREIVENEAVWEAINERQRVEKYYYEEQGKGKLAKESIFTVSQK